MKKLRKRGHGLVEHAVGFFAPFCLKFLSCSYGASFPPSQELSKSQANRFDLGKRIPIFGMRKNRTSPGLLVALLFDLFVIVLLEILILGKMDPNNMPSVPQEGTSARTTA